MSTLAEFRSRALVMLGDPAGSRYSTAQLDESLRAALEEYSEAFPQAMSQVVAVSAEGRQQPLDVPGSLKTLVRAQYPYSGDSSPFFELMYLSYPQGAPAVFFAGEAVPQAGEQFKVFYTAAHSVDGLDGAEATSVPAAHEGLLVRGAAGYACYMRAAQLSESLASSGAQLLQLAGFHLANFRAALARTRLEIAFEYPLRGFEMEP